MFWIGMLIGTILGVLAIAIVSGSRRDDDGCRECKEYYMSIIRDKDSEIHGLKSTKGALAKELQNLTFMNSGYRAR
jgi:hypothetical protein